MVSSMFKNEQNANGNNFIESEEVETNFSTYVKYHRTDSVREDTITCIQMTVKGDSIIAIGFWLSRVPP